jgi:hypothetical protein
MRCEAYLKEINKMKPKIQFKGEITPSMMGRSNSTALAILLITA